MDWQAIVARKRAKRDSLLPPKWLVPAAELPADEVTDVSKLCAEKGWLSPDELAITALGAAELAKAIYNGQYSSVSVIEAFAHRATIAQQLLNPYVAQYIQWR